MEWVDRNAGGAGNVSPSFGFRSDDDGTVIAATESPLAFALSRSHPLPAQPSDSPTLPPAARTWDAASLSLAHLFSPSPWATLGRSEKRCEGMLGGLSLQL